MKKYNKFILDNINDILDSKGKNKNFLNNNLYSDEYIKFANKWSKLPLYQNKNSIKDFFDLLNTKQVILVISGTGSGKTVLIPKFFLKYLYYNDITDKKIAITNPKIVTTQSNAIYNAKTLDVELGKEVGYKYKGSSKSCFGDKTKLLYATDGLILSLCYTDNLLTEYAGVIVDEAHERNIQIDVLLKQLKNIVLKRKDFKIIIMSATINAEVFKNYFDIDEISYGSIEISGDPNYPIEQNWLENNIKVNRTNYLDVALNKCYEILKKSDIGDILVFVATEKDAINGCNILKEKCSLKLDIYKERCNKLFCIEFFSKMNKNNKNLATDKDLYKQNKYNRKIIFSTNLAESSITFDGLIYVVDSGFELLNYYDSVENSNVITKIYTTQAQINQRIGRTGRTQPGIAYHIYTKESYESFKKYPDPSILLSDLTDTILSLLITYKTIRNVLIVIKDLITVPSINQIITALYILSFYKCIKLIHPKKNYDDDEIVNDSINIEPISIPWLQINNINNIDNIINGALTNIGNSIFNFRSCKLITSIAVILSKYMGCSDEIITIMSLIDSTDGKINSLLSYKKKDLKKVKQYFKNYVHVNSDHLTLLNIYKKLFKNKKDMYLNISELKKVSEKVRNIKHYATSIDNKIYQYMNEKYKLIEIKPYNDITMNILYVLYKSHEINLLKHDNKNIYTSLNYLVNSTAQIEYLDITKINNYNKNAICYCLENTFGNKHFKCITQLPNNFFN